jgi:hypothetical protein
VSKDLDNFTGLDSDSFERNLHLDENGSWKPLYPSETERPLKHIEADYNFKVLSETLAGYRIFPTGNTPTEHNTPKNFSGDVDKILTLKQDGDDLYWGLDEGPTEIPVYDSTKIGKILAVVGDNSSQQLKWVDDQFEANTNINRTASLNDFPSYSSEEGKVLQVLNGSLSWEQGGGSGVPNGILKVLNFETTGNDIDVGTGIDQWKVNNAGVYKTGEDSLTSSIPTYMDGITPHTDSSSAPGSRGLRYNRPFTRENSSKLCYEIKTNSRFQYSGSAMAIGWTGEVLAGETTSNGFHSNDNKYVLYFGASKVKPLVPGTVQTGVVDSSTGVDIFYSPVTPTTPNGKWITPTDWKVCIELHPTGGATATVWMDDDPIPVLNYTWDDSQYPLQNNDDAFYFATSGPFLTGYGGGGVRDYWGSVTIKDVEIEDFAQDNSMLIKVTDGAQWKSNNLNLLSDWPNPGLGDGDKFLQAYINGNGDYQFRWTDIAVITGDPGADGKSAREIWNDLGNAGDDTAFIASLKGADGANGTKGIDGLAGIDGVDYVHPTYKEFSPGHPSTNNGTASNFGTYNINVIIETGTYDYEDSLTKGSIIEIEQEATNQANQQHNKSVYFKILEATDGNNGTSFGGNDYKNLELEFLELKHSNIAQGDEYWDRIAVNMNTIYNYFITIHSIVGQDGADGVIGVDGDKGDKGDRGEPGTNGLDGDKGDKCDRGEAGTNGIDGMAGTTPIAQKFLVSTAEVQDGPERVNVFTIDSVSQSTLELFKGHTYEFELDSRNTDGHPFTIQTLPNKHNIGALVTGLKTSGDIITWTVPHDIVDTVYYVCEKHENMGAAINLNTLDPVSLKGADGADGTDGTDATPLPAYDAGDANKVLKVQQYQGQASLYWGTDEDQYPNTLIQLQDIPGISGEGGKVLKVNSAGNGFEWADEQTGSSSSGGGLTLADLSNARTSYDVAANEIVRITSSISINLPSNNSGNIGETFILINETNRAITLFNPDGDEFGLKSYSTVTYMQIGTLWSPISFYGEQVEEY